MINVYLGLQVTALLTRVSESIALGFLFY